MKTKVRMKNYIEYAKYILKHKWYVFCARKLVGASFYDCLIHDLSKLYPSEWFPYMNTFYMLDGTKTYKHTIEFDIAWKKHQNRNKHHWQYWVLIEDNGYRKALPMDLRYIKEMIADWIGASLAINGKNDVIRWYELHKNKILFHPDTRIIVEDLLDNLK